MWWIRVKKTGALVNLHPNKNNLGYKSQDRAVTALKTSGFCEEYGLLWADLELINRIGKTMEEMKAVRAVEGKYAMLHSEGWYWIHPHTKKIWYSNPHAVERAWKSIESELSIHEGWSLSRPRKMGFIMVKGKANGQIEKMTNWFC